MLLARHLYRHTPADRVRGLHDRRRRDGGADPAGADTRVGYLLYPINFLVWAYLLAEPGQTAELLSPEVTAAAPINVGADVRAHANAGSAV